MGVLARTKPGLVLTANGNARHHADGRLIQGIVRLEIEGEDEGSFYLFHFDLDGRNVIDTWRQTLDEALQQAALEYGGSPNDWIMLET